MNDGTLRVVRPEEPPAGVSVDADWLNVSYGSKITANGRTRIVREVRLYRVDPAAFNGEVVDSGRSWLDSDQQ